MRYRFELRFGVDVFEYHGIVSKTIEFSTCQIVLSRCKLTGCTGIHIKRFDSKREIDMQ